MCRPVCHAPPSVEVTAGEPPATALVPVLSVVLGIAFLSGTFVFTDSLRANFDDLFNTVYAKTGTAVVRSSQKIEAGQGLTQRGRIPDTLVARVAAVPGVKAADGSVSGYARRSGPRRETDRDGPGVADRRVLVSELDLTVWKLQQGRLPTRGDRGDHRRQVLQGRRVHALGERISVIGQTGTRSFAFVGVVRFGTVDSRRRNLRPVRPRHRPGLHRAEGPDRQHQHLRQRRGGTQSELAARVHAAMPDTGTETLTGQQIAADSSSEIKKALGFFNACCWCSR